MKSVILHPWSTDMEPKKIGKGVILHLRSPDTEHKITKVLFYTCDPPIQNIKKNYKGVILHLWSTGTD